MTGVGVVEELGLDQIVAQEFVRFVDVDLNFFKGCRCERVTVREVVVAITNGKLDFGPWEQIFYGEFDGQRRKRVLVKIIGE